jgi:hypothetical protein
LKVNGLLNFMLHLPFEHSDFVVLHVSSFVTTMRKFHVVHGDIWMMTFPLNHEDEALELYANLCVFS